MKPTLKTVVKEQLRAMLARNLDYSPPAEDLPSIADVWTADFIRMGLTDADAGRLRTAFDTVGTSTYKWPQPRLVFERLPDPPPRADDYLRCSWMNGTSQCLMPGTISPSGVRYYCLWHYECLNTPRFAQDRTEFERWHERLFGYFATDLAPVLRQKRNLPVIPRSAFDQDTEVCWSKVLGSPVERGPRTSRDPSEAEAFGA